MKKSTNQPKPKMNTLSSFTMFSDELNSDFDFIMYFKQATRKTMTKKSVKVDGVVVSPAEWKSIKYIPSIKVKNMTIEDEFTSETIRFDLYNHYPKNKVSKLASGRINNLDKLVNGADIETYLTHTELDFFVDIAIINHADGKEMKGIVYYKEKDDKNLKRLHIQFKEKLSFCQDSETATYGFQYNGTKATNVIKEVQKTRLITDNTIIEVVQKIEAMDAKSQLGLWYKLPKSLRSEFVSYESFANNTQQNRATTYNKNHPSFNINDIDPEALNELLNL